MYSEAEHNHSMTRDVQEIHHNCPVCSQDFSYQKSTFYTSGATTKPMAKSQILVQAPSSVVIDANSELCKDPSCAICKSKAQVQYTVAIDYKKQWATPCAICGETFHGVTSYQSSGSTWTSTLPFNNTVVLGGTKVQQNTFEFL